MPSSAFDFAYTRARQQLQELEEQLDAAQGRLPDPATFDSIRQTVDRLRSICPADQESMWRDLARDRTALHARARESYIRAIDDALSIPETLLDEAGQIRQDISLWIDALGRTFDDNALAGEKRRKLNQAEQTERARRLLHATETQLTALWAQAEAKSSPDEIIRTYDDAHELSRQAQAQATQFGAPADVHAKLRALEVQARIKYDDARRRHYVPVTSDTLFEFSKVIQNFQRIKEEVAPGAPEPLVSYYPEPHRASVETVPVSRAIEVARERWSSFVAEKVETYRTVAARKLKDHDPEGARAEIEQLWKLDVPSLEDLLSPSQSLVEISADLRLSLGGTLRDLETAETELRNFRDGLNVAVNAATAVEAWRQLVTVEQTFPQFTGRDSSWLEIRPKILTRYQQELRYRLREARAALRRGDYAGVHKKTAEVIDAAVDRDLEQVAREALELQQACDDVRDTLSELNRRLRSGQPGQVLDAQAQLNGLDQRLRDVGLDNLENVGDVRAKIKAAVDADALLARLRAAAQSYDLNVLAEALADAHSATKTIPKDHAQELGALRSLLEAKHAFALGTQMRTQGDLEQASVYFYQAAQHPELKIEAGEELRKVEQAVQADETVRSTLEVIQRQSPCDAVETLRKLRGMPTRMRRALNDALTKAEDLCRASLEAQLTAVQSSHNLDVDAVQQVLTQLDQLDPERANQHKTRLTPILADREAQLACAQGMWAKAREKWEAALAFDQTFDMAYRAALKQETLDLANVLVDALPDQTINDLEQKLAQALAGDPELLLALAKGRLAQTRDVPWVEAEQGFGKAAQAADQARRRFGEWRRTLPPYEQERRRWVELAGAAVDPVATLIQQAQALAEQIVAAKKLARRKARIEDYLGRKTLVHTLSGLREKDRIEQQPDIDREERDGFCRWWNEQTYQLVVELEGRIDELDGQPSLTTHPAEQPLSVIEGEPPHAWELLEARLIILVLDPSNPNGQQACLLLPHQVALLTERFDAERKNTTGAGRSGPERIVVEHHITYLMPLYSRAEAVEGALNHLATHGTLNGMIQPPESTWSDQRANFARQVAPFRTFFGQLVLLKSTREAIEQEIQSALCTGEWEAIETRLIPPYPLSTPVIPTELQNHRSARWLVEHLRSSKEFRARQVRRRNEVLWALQFQNELDALPWSESQPTRAEQTVIELPASRDRTGREWALYIHTQAREQAHTPVEMCSLLEQARDLLTDMKEDAADRCCLDASLVWRDPTRTERVGREEIYEALLPLLEEIDEMRAWLQPVTGGFVRHAIAREGRQAVGNGGVGHGMVDWRAICERADELRQRRQFVDAIALCERTLGNTDGVGGKTAGSDDGAWSLRQAREYLTHETPLQGHSPRTGLTMMLVNYASSLRAKIEKDIKQTTQMILQLRTLEETYSVAWQNFSAQLTRYRMLRQRAARPLIGRRWSAPAEQARLDARLAYEACCRICPKDPNLVAQRPVLGIDHDCTDVLVLCDWAESGDRRGLR